jgi:hypothetical protein
VVNTEKIDYWKDVTTTKTEGKSRNYAMYGSIYGSSFNSSTSVKPEQIVFIAPKSTITKDQFILFRPSKVDLPGESSKFLEEQRKDDPSRKINIRFYDYSESNSPLKFRNFLTLSTSDKFEKESYIDNGFYVSKISEMDKNNFLGLHIENSYVLPYTDQESFYTEEK